MRIVGLVLAGGRSRRFGSEKATAALEGRPLIAHVAAALDLGCAALAVSAPAGSGAAAWARAHDLALLPDPAGAPDGPLAGVLEGLRWAAAMNAQALATAPCDTPRLPRDLVERLAAALAAEPGAGAATVRVGSDLHPLCTAWRVGAPEAVEAALAGGGHPPVRGMLARLHAVEVAFDDARAFTNANTPADLPQAG